MFTTCILLTVMAHAPAAAEDNKDPFLPQILVQAKATRVVYDESPQQVDVSQKVSFQIQHVYCGDTELKGKTFQSSFTIDNYPLQNIFHPPIKEGEVGIWTLTYDDDEKLTLGIENYVLASDDYRVSFPIPIRKIIAANFHSTNYGVSYASALKWAGVVETVYKASSAERQKLLRRYISSDNPCVAAWSTRILAEYAPTDLIPYLKKCLEDPNLTVGAQVTIDAILSKNDRKNWLASKQRAALLQHWVSGDIIETLDVCMIVARIESALKFDALDWETWLPLMEKWILEQHLSEELVSDLYELYHETTSGDKTPKSHARRQLILNRAFDLLKSSKDQNTQFYAAEWLDHIGRLSNNELLVVKDLMGKSKNPHLRTLLTRVIENSKPPPHHPCEEGEKN